MGVRVFCEKHPHRNLAIFRHLPPVHPEESEDIPVKEAPTGAGLGNEIKELCA